MSIVKKTREQYISEVSKLHDFKYSYHLLDYEGSKFTVCVTCPIHGNFNIIAAEHKRGKGCQKCSLIRRANSHKHTKEMFIEISSKLHNNKYDYSLLKNYEGENTIVPIICPTHGKYLREAVQHKMGRGCGECGKEAGYLKMLDTQEDFLEKSKKVHSDKYDYSDSVYTSDSDNIKIYCKHHGDFWQLPSNHKAGSGCPSCADYGFSNSKPAIFYILVCDNLTKVGITNTESKQRIKRISKSSGFNFVLHTELKSESGKWISDLENRVLGWLKDNYKNVNSKFEGSTECFEYVDINKLLDFISPYREDTQ